MTARVLSSGPFPPLTKDDCPNLYPGVDYMGCFELGDNQAGWTDGDFEPTGSKLRLAHRLRCAIRYCHGLVWSSLV